jgi:hypothetical protein
MRYAIYDSPRFSPERSGRSMLEAILGATARVYARTFRHYKDVVCDSIGYEAILEALLDRAQVPTGGVHRETGRLTINTETGPVYVSVDPGLRHPFSFAFRDATP